ncbi:MAG: Terminase-like family protein, partial [Oscillospiraceae bacterium]|nr:Terminase-like family protein [Oscillospiraceae bacterium]
FEPGDNQRIPGWMQLHFRLRFDEAGVPMLYVFRNCRSFLRTMPLLKYDRVRPEDVDSELEDHIADMCRYVCMARPVKPRHTERKKKAAFDPLQTDEAARYDRYAFYKTY